MPLRAGRDALLACGLRARRDEFIGQPYWYVNHGPETQRRSLPALAEGEWFTDGWIGAVLRGDVLVAAGNASDQEGRLRAFLASAVPASRALALESPLRSA